MDGGKGAPGMGGYVAAMCVCEEEGVGWGGGGHGLATAKAARRHGGRAGLGNMGLGQAHRWTIYPMIDCSGKLWTLGTSECEELEGGASCTMIF